MTGQIMQTRLTQSPVWILAAFAAPAFALVTLYFFVFHGSLSSSSAAWGTFGDYVGGVAGTVVALGAFVALLETLRIQALAFERQQGDSNRAATLAYTTAVLQALSQTAVFYEGSRNLSAMALTRLLDQRTESAAAKTKLAEMVREVSTQVEEYGEMLRLLQNELAFIISEDPTADVTRARVAETFRKLSELDSRRMRYGRDDTT